MQPKYRTGQVLKLLHSNDLVKIVRVCNAPDYVDEVQYYEIVRLKADGTPDRRWQKTPDHATGHYTTEDRLTPIKAITADLTNPVS